ncbi:prolyl oligopeptidase family protein [Prosthecobacter fusiformis]|uniref:Prolyl oligopeptidase family protein n=1 Tax=Prosthecobacter fusiformis TaxID=48464 RepID=A0A4R7RUC5_9BACT|nr:prolyl oligopeptidase family serine peptidase [Prosthecobacter fusiformis]TDU69344.1 prolyl oligopeptidase family protein [Prosthecobacter fusiformis]
MHRSLLLAFSLATLASAQLRPDGATASFRGSLPPKPVAALSVEQEASLEKKLASVAQSFQAVKKHPRAADADIFLKAVRYALDFDEWYDKKPEDGIKKATALLDEAKRRITSLKENKTPWMDGSGQKVLGFYSQIDGSPQPYGVEVPEGLEFSPGKKPIPMWVWLHGRGDTATDLHFVYNRLNAKKPGQFQPKGTIVIHPFGRYCNGWKSAGETDVFEARDDATARFNVDENRIALAGFSMGGAGAWHIGAHFADQWACVHPGAGFADVKRYQKLTPDKYPSLYEQTLWGVYDVPDYARNFFNVPLIVYSGENDTQRDAAAYMEGILKNEGLTIPHLIGPGMGHKYHPEVIKDVQAKIEAAVEKGRDSMPKKVILQTKTLGYNKMFWVRLLAQEKQWEDTRIEAEMADDGILRATTKNVASFSLNPNSKVAGYEIDGQKLTGGQTFRRDAQGGWRTQSNKDSKENSVWLKQPGQSGPIEEPLKRPFLVVLPEGDSASPQVTAWVNSESRHFLTRWRSLMRGDVKVKKAADVTSDDMLRYTLVLWGDAVSNPLVAKVLLAGSTAKLLLTWTKEKLVLGPHSMDGSTHVPVMIRPNPLEPRGTVILNSGLTFREAHDRTNSLQNPKLPDWAILDITQPPNAESAGKVVAADFFDEFWQVKAAQ